MNTKWTLLCLLPAAFACGTAQNDDVSWPVYGGSKQNTRYSEARQIDTSNVHLLQPAWEYRTGDADSNTQIQVNPLVVDGVLYGVSPKLKLFALDAATGSPQWVYDPVKDSSTARASGNFGFNICRGLAMYQQKKERLLFYSADSKLYCINALTGTPNRNFGKNGAIDLKLELGRETADLYVASTTPGIIYKDLIIIGTRVAEEARAAPGHIRAYDVHTGKLRWRFHTIPQPGEPGFETWHDTAAYRYVGGANSWAGFSMDEKRGIVYVPTGSAVYDFYGGKRKGDNLYANCILALDAETGKKRWHYQTVHHDVWDRDLPAAPVLLELKKGDKSIDALAQVTKTGWVFLLDRLTGEPIYPIPEKPVPVSDALPAEYLSPTQPYPSFPEPFVRQQMTINDLNTLVSGAEFAQLRKRFEELKSDHLFAPPSRQGTLIFPGFDGGAEWGGPAYDAETGMLYVNANEVPWILTMVPAKPTHAAAATYLQAGKRIFASSCASCHGADKKGSSNVPSLLGVERRVDSSALLALLNMGQRMMPSFAHLSDEEKRAVSYWLLNDTVRGADNFKEVHRPENDYHQLPYVSTGYHKFLTSRGDPAVAPPWGTLNAVNLHTGKLEWKLPLGGENGTENYGGPVVTAGGLVFIAATSDSKIRAFNKRTGAMLWEANLPAPGFATPAVYEIDGQQYLVIACGGGKLGKKGHDAYVAFTIFR